jgi:uncharacterized iron-regulated membrane protein
MGLAAGLVIMVTCLTGAILVFEKELQQLFSKERYFVNKTGTRLSTDSLLKNVTAAIPKGKIASIKVYNDPNRTAEVVVNKPAAKKSNKAQGKGKPESTRLVAFVDPYTGGIIEFYDHKKSFFYFTMDLHRWMLGGDTGKLIVGICTTIFLFIIITGIILWWPKNRAILKQRLKIKSNAGYKRLNHDYHVVLGFYSAIFLFVFAFTGLAWSFEWFNKGIYKVTRSSMEKAPTPKSQILDSTKRIDTETALQTVVHELGTASYYNMSLPKDSTDPFSITLLPPDPLHESATDTYFVDAYTGTIAGIQKFKDRNLGQRVRATFKPVHVASVYGTTSKVIGFIVCLLGTFLPLTGIIMWINRIRKKKNGTQNKSTS